MGQSAVFERKKEEVWRVSRRTDSRRVNESSMNI